jgi:hypothetical protein
VPLLSSCRFSCLSTIEQSHYHYWCEMWSRSQSPIPQTTYKLAVLEQSSDPSRENLVHPNSSTAVAEVIGLSGFHPYNKHHVNLLYVHRKYGVETKGTNDLGCYCRWICPSTAVDGLPWWLRELGVLGQRGHV